MHIIADFGLLAYQQEQQSKKEHPNQDFYSKHPPLSYYYLINSRGDAWTQETGCWSEGVLACWSFYVEQEFMGRENPSVWLAHHGQSRVDILNWMKQS